jgi:hypothetical protein
MAHRPPRIDIRQAPFNGTGGDQLSQQLVIRTIRRLPLNDGDHLVTR